MSKDSLSECRVLLGPMAGVSDAAFRKLCRECGADIACTEMVSAKGMSYSNVKTGRLLELYPGEDRVIAQIFGHEPNVMADAAKRIEQDLGEHLECIDINMGCPARKITSKGDGAALMKDINLASSIVEAVAASVVQPVSVKFRRGWSPDTENAVGFAQAMERAGADRLCIHGRYAVQFYAGKADWDIIRRIKEAVSVPVIGNGDVASAQEAVSMVCQTGCDAVMIARGARGNPWIFAQVKAALDGKGETEVPTLSERMDMAKRHVELMQIYHPESLVRMRKHAMWYLAGVPFAARARQKINDASSLQDFYLIFDEVLWQNDGRSDASRSV